MKKILQKKNIIAIQTFNQSHKSIDIINMIERINKILKVIIRKMKMFEENFFDILRRIIAVINDRHIEYLSYTFNEINYDIKFKNQTIVNAIKLLKFLEKIILFISKNIMSLI